MYKMLRKEISYGLSIQCLANYFGRNHRRTVGLCAADAKHLRLNIKPILSSKIYEGDFALELIVQILIMLVGIVISALAIIIPILLSLMATAGWIYFLYRIIYWAINR